IPRLEEGMHLIVLPLDVQGDRTTLGYITEGLEEELSRKLAALQVLHVVSASAAKEQAKAQKLDLMVSPDTVARNFGINLIVRGIVQQGGEWTRIKIDVYDVPGARLLLAMPFSYQTTGIKLLELVNEVYKAIVRVLRLKPEIGEANPTNNNEAYDHYLEG